MNIRVSVAMAVYNGEKYLAEQMASILEQLGPNDELVLSVDPSSDRSWQIIRRFADADRRILALEGPGQGVVRNFENALTHTQGAYIFLSDQDDIWMKEKLTCCLDTLEKEGAIAVMHDALLTDESLRVREGLLFGGVFCPGVLTNIVRNRYTGCCMAFKRELLNAALPFPRNLPMHDQWIGILARRLGAVAFINKPLICYRRHSGTATGREKAGWLQRIRWRVNIACAYFKWRKRDVQNQRFDRRL